jgi:ABC-type Na+ efflux pump permease subunit
LTKNDQARNILTQMLTVGGIVGGVTGGLESSQAVLEVLIVFVLVSLIFYSLLVVDELLPPLPAALFIPFTFGSALSFSVLMGEVIFAIANSLVLALSVVAGGTLVLSWALLYQYYYQKVYERFSKVYKSRAAERSSSGGS